MPELFTEIAEDKLICESCGKEFSCGANVGKCWCFEVDLDKETSAKLRRNFKNCLCEDCLVKPLIRQKSERIVKEVL